MIFNDYSLTTIIAVFFAAVIAITLHEFAHGYVALLNGDRTAKHAGRLTLNPVKHFDPIGFLMLMVAGFGYAKPVPVNPYNFKHLKRGIFTVAIAGIALNLLLAFFTYPILILIYKALGNLTANETSFRLVAFVGDFFSYFVGINIALALFNLLPFYPLDGFRILESFTRYNNKITTFLRSYGSYILIGLIGIGVIVSFFPGEIFRYFDILGLYINSVSGYINKAFYWFWSLLGVKA